MLTFFSIIFIGLFFLTGTIAIIGYLSLFLGPVGFIVGILLSMFLITCTIGDVVSETKQKEK